MGRHTWIAGLVLCAGLIDRQTASGQPLIHVLLMDQAEVPPDTRQRAQDVATRVFHLSGLTLVWVDAGTCQGRCLTVRIVTQPVSAKSRDPHMLGVAPSVPEARGINLWSFYPRIRAHSAELGMDASQMLGHVIAHEMGHLLLPYGAHSVAGLMRPKWDRSQVRAADRGFLTFTPDQAGLREHLQASASPSAHDGILQVCVRNDAHVADDTLDEARRVVSDVYSQAGLTLLWCADDCAVTIALRPRASSDTARRAKDAMGYTPGGGEERGRLAFVLINRVHEVADGYSTARSLVLGTAMAHELGHLLISKEHSKTGIMKAYFNQSDFRKARQRELRLTAEQARHIRGQRENRDGEHLTQGCGMAGTARAARAQPGAPIATTDQRETTIVLHVANYAALSRHVLDGAKARVAKVYEVIGVRTEWVDSAESVTQLHDGRLHLAVILPSRDMAEKKVSAGGITDHVLGQAHFASWRAYIFCDRIAAVAGAKIMFPISLGNVIAHEIGHLLLRVNRHSPNGIMRANVDLHAVDLEGFDESQASSIRTMLLELASINGRGLPHGLWKGPPHSTRTVEYVALPQELCECAHCRFPPTRSQNVQAEHVLPRAAHLWCRRATRIASALRKAIPSPNYSS